MTETVSNFLKTTLPFSKLPDEAIARIRDTLREKRLSAGDVLAEQGRSSVENIYIIRYGVLELYSENKGERTVIDLRGPGEIFGGISILENSGVALRTVRVREDAACYLLPRQAFLSLCERHKRFQEYFTDRFRRNMQDNSYAAEVSRTQASLFLTDIIPFSFLPDEEIEFTAKQLSIVNYPEHKILFVQGQSRVDSLYIIRRGAAERYFEEEGEQTLHSTLSEGDMYGGISMLVNDGIAVRTLRTREPARFYTLPRAVFLDLCRRYPGFSEYFTDTFGKRMLNRSYAEIIARTARNRDRSLLLFNLRVENFYTPNPLTCPPDTTIHEAADTMRKHRCSSIFVSRGTAGGEIGIVTDNDLRTKVIAGRMEIDRPVTAVMSSPVEGIESNALVFEALLTMMQKNIKHLAVFDENGEIRGVITNHDLLKAQGDSPFLLIREIARAESKSEIIDIHTRLPRIVQSVIQNGALAKNVTRLVTTVSDTILRKLIGFALADQDPPPVPFVFMIMGSEGRQEQTLKTDQDNAIIYEDVPESEEAAVHDYFLRFGETVCTWLDEAGYRFCEGGIMAKNPKCCRSFSRWKTYFHHWIFEASPEDLLNSSIFFDFRGAYGHTDFTDRLRRYLHESLRKRAGFFRDMTENALHFKPPIGFFRNFVVESKGEHKDTIDLKAAMQPIVDIARIYALKNEIEETNTLERIRQLFLRRVIQRKEYQDLEHAYNFLMQLRFVRQITAIIEETAKPENHVNPKSLSRIQQTMLKEIFKRIEKYQSRISFDFTGMT